MPTEPSESFADNWAYLRMELRWLDQVLMTAVARQRKENHEIDRVTHARADRVTSSWWKGIISTEGKAMYDEHRQPAPAGSKITYPQQLESKIQASYSQGILLALPSLRDRLKLTPFEKNLVLMSLAPEINRRYARLYRYLQGDELAKTDLPTLDLVLRLMCRNDLEWRDARHHLVTASPLIRLQLLHLSPHLSDSLLNCPLKLAAPLVNYLLAGHPTDYDLEVLLQSPPGTLARSTPLTQTELAVDWSDLVLPSALLSSLQSLTQRIQGQTQAKTQWGFQPDRVLNGTIAVLAGAAGTGKTRAAAAIAHMLDTALYSLDLALIDPNDAAQVLSDLIAKAPPVLLLKSAELWFGRSSFLPPHALRQFWAERQQIRGITLLSVCRAPALQFQWRQQADQILVFPLPSLSDRLQLWQKAFPPEIPLSPDIDWQALANLPLRGGEIVAIAQTAILYAAAAERVEMQHLVQGLTQRGKSLQRSSDSRQAAAPGKKSASAKAAINLSEKAEITGTAAKAAKKTSSSKAAQKPQTKKRKPES